MGMILPPTPSHPDAAMIRPLLLVCSLLLLSCVRLGAQDDMNKFLSDFAKALEYNDDKAIDKTVKNNARWALRHFQDLEIELNLNRRQEVQKQIDALEASYARCFEGAEVLDKIERWAMSQTKETYEVYRKLSTALAQCYGLRDEAFKQNTNRKTNDDAVADMVKVAQALDQSGHLIDAAEAWALASSTLTRAPDRTVEDRRTSMSYLDRFLDNRKAWYWTTDPTYIQNAEWSKSEKLAIEQAAKDEKVRAAAGYDANTKGIDALLMPDAKDDVHDLEFEMLKDWDQLDYCVKGGPVPASWWQGNFDDKDHTKAAPLPWFRAATLSLVRDSATSTKYGISVDPKDPKASIDIDVGAKAKPSQFFLDAGKTVPYAMFFWQGGEKERVGDADVNLAPAPQNTAIFYRSAASWHAHVGSDKLTLYDDSGNGSAMDSEPQKDELKLYTLGQPEAGQVVPLLDSMQVGKGPRVPFSEFVQIGSAWFHLRSPAAGKIALRPFNPQYMQTGKIKLAWSGPKPTAPVQLVIQGKGDYATAWFDIASGKEIEVPATEYRVVYGRILQGKGVRLQTATIWQGSSKPFTVTAGKTTEVKMGAPFTLAFERAGSDPDVEIDGRKILLRESSGCVLAEPQNMVPVPDVLAAKNADGKGAKVVGKFVKLDDPELLNKASGLQANTQLRLSVAYFPVPEGQRDGSQTFKCKLPAPGMKVGLSIKKHPLFGKVDSEFQ